MVNGIISGYERVSKGLSGCNCLSQDDKSILIDSLTTKIDILKSCVNDKRVTEYNRDQCRIKLEKIEDMELTVRTMPICK